ncbi:MAG: RsmD family RNA methyltransferase [Treponema sp.]|jgi:16S rRNA (guanine(966)-N(2))-methyltransferase RsmD|nr:RsmD family RNA methyltransferase [Treponema sp.]
MRITGGSLAGRRVEVPPGEIRPSMDRMRESLFSTLGDICGLSFLDIFTGSGIIALEAASRGAVFIEAIEQDKLKGKILLKNVSISPCRINCRFIPAEIYVKRAKNTFDIIFLDPPFPYKFKWELIFQITASCLVKNGTKILIHRPRPEYLKTNIPNLKKIDIREYGRSVVDFFVFETPNI